MKPLRTETIGLSYPIFFPQHVCLWDRRGKALHAVSVGQPPQSLLRAFGAAVIGSVGLQPRPLRTHDWKHRAELI